MESEEVILEIEYTQVKCKKHDLISNSDYFKAMFEGNFMEKDKNIVEIKDVDLKAMNIILTLLWDDTYYIEDEDVLMVLQAACMLQFCKIQNLCTHKIIDILSPKNCLKIWIMTEQLDIKPLYLKAKYMALAEFMYIKETDSVLELTVDQLRNYLGNVNLKTDNEVSVFQTVMKWWYENGNSYDKSRDLLKLLSCVNFKILPKNQFNEILTYPDIVNSDVGKILTCCYNILNNETIESFSEQCIDNAKLLTKTINRKLESFPCLLVSTTYSGVPNKRVKLESNEKIIYYDHRLDKFELLFDISPKTEKLEGFELMGYKEFVFLYGGEFLLGRGEWNFNFWTYDTIKEKWQRKSTIAFPRRHLQTCIIGSKVFLAGGIGPFRVNQDNIFWYDYVKDKWSDQKDLPVFDTQLKCCDFLDKFFIFSISNSCGYFFNDELKSWQRISVKLDNNVFNVQLAFSIFSYKSRLYVKGKNLLELTLLHNQLLVSSVKSITTKAYDKLDITVCSNMVYTLYKYQVEDNYSYSLEKYDLATGDLGYIFENMSDNDVIIANKEEFKIDPTLKMFSFSHYSLVEGNALVNNYF